MREPIIDTDTFEDAQLDGIACKATAWVEVTQVESLIGHHSARFIPGVRTWRGRAIVYDAHFLDRWPLNVAIEFKGKLRDGEEGRDICADVFIYRTSRRKHLASSQGNGHAGEEPIFIDFIGAGNPYTAI